MLNDMMDRVMSGNYGVHSNSTADYFLWKFTNKELQPLLDEIEDAKSFTFEKANSTLIGQIKNEYILKKSNDHILKLMSPLLNDYDLYSLQGKDYNAMGGDTKDKQWYMTSMWVNFQKKYEFNPPHSHSGLYSFVIWIDIPYTMEEEEKHSPGKDANDGNTAGMFYFLNQGAGKIYMTKLPVDKSWNGTVAIFPSSTMHGVNPFFTSDKHRITVSGNVIIR